jgi:hypothetical protein
MEQPQTGVQEQTVIASPVHEDRPVPLTSSVEPVAHTVFPQACGAAATATALVANGAPGSPSWVYAIGKIEARFPSVSVEKEFAQAAGRADTKGQTDRQAIHATLSKPENRYLGRQLCFVMTIGGMETYILVPRDASDLGLLIDAVRPNPSPLDLDVLIGMKGPVAPPQMCNGLMVPIVVFDQIYSFDREALIKAIPKPEKASAKEFVPAAEELFDRIMQMTDNAGATNEHRALNYLAVRYHAIYANAAEAFAKSASLTAVNVVPSSMSGTRTMVDVIFSYTNRHTDVTEKFFCRVDVTDEFPFMVKKLSPYYDR